MTKKKRLIGIFAVLFAAMMALSCVFFSACGLFGSSSDSEEDTEFEGDNAGDEGDDGSDSSGDGAVVKDEDSRVKAPAGTIEWCGTEYTPNEGVTLEYVGTLLTDGTKLYEASGVASRFETQEQADTYWYGTAETGDRYVYLEIAVAPGETMTWSNGTYTNNTGKDDVGEFVIGIYEGAPWSFNISTGSAETGDYECVTYTVNFDGMTNLPDSAYLDFPAAGNWHGENVGFLVTPTDTESYGSLDITIDEKGFSLTAYDLTSDAWAGMTRDEVFDLYVGLGLTYDEYTETYCVVDDFGDTVLTFTLAPGDDRYEEKVTLSFSFTFGEGITFTCSFTDVELGRRIYDTDVLDVTTTLSDTNVDTGYTLTVAAEVTMRLEDATYEGTYTWTSSNEAILTVEGNGDNTATVTAKAKGAATVTVTLDDDEGHEATSERIDVVIAHAIDASFEKQYIFFEAGTDLYSDPSAEDASGKAFSEPKLTIGMSKEGVTYDFLDIEGTYTWTSSNEEFATVNEIGKVTFNDVSGAGANTTITVTLNDGVSASYVIAVKNGDVSNDPVVGEWINWEVEVEILFGTQPMRETLAAEIIIESSGKFSLYIQFQLGNDVEGLGDLLAMFGMVDEDGVLDLFVNQDWFRAGDAYYVVIEKDGYYNTFYDGVIVVTINEDGQLCVAFDDVISLDLSDTMGIDVGITFDTTLEKYTY